MFKPEPDTFPVYSVETTTDEATGAITVTVATADTTAPTMVYTSAASAITVTVSDAGSGLYAVTVDGGTTWTALADGLAAGTLKDLGNGLYQFSCPLPQGGELAVGAIMAADVAGNIAKSPKITVQQSQPQGGMGGFGGMSGGSGFGGSTGSTRTVSHSSSTVETVTAYNGVELVLTDGGMNTLVVGDTQLDLDLRIDAPEYQVTDAVPSFTADFAGWRGASATDTIVLTALEDAVPDGTGYVWEFSGTVYKKLAASGIDYMVFRVGDRVTALSTAGFTAGVRYNMYRSAGMASKDFLYTLRMSADGASMQLSVTVGGETYVLSADASAEYYYHDVYTGTDELLNAA